MEKEETLSGPMCSLHGPPAIGRALFTSTVTSCKWAPDSLPITMPWDGLTAAWPQVGAHNGFFLAHSPQGSAQGRAAREAPCLGGLSEFRDLAVP